MRLFCTLFEWRRVILSKVADFNLPHLHLAPPLGITQFEFRKDFWQQKTRIHVLSCGVERFDTILACDKQTDRHTATAYTVLV